MNTPTPSHPYCAFDASAAPLEPATWASEQELADHICDALRQFFVVDREVLGTTIAGKRVRLDAVLTPRQTLGWKDPQTALGLEFKLLNLAGDVGGRQVTRLFGQCLDYTHTRWDSYGYLVVFSYPSIVELITGQTRTTDDRDADPVVFWVTRLLSRAGIGELIRHPQLGWTLLLQGRHVVWSEASGPDLARTSPIKRSFGSR